MFFCTEIGLLPERQVEPLEVLVRLIQKKYSIQVRMYKEIGDANYDDPKSSILPDYSRDIMRYLKSISNGPIKLLDDLKL